MAKTLGPAPAGRRLRAPRPRPARLTVFTAPAPPSFGLPTARGPITERLFAALCRPKCRLPTTLDPVDDPLDDDDLHLALYCCYELSYRGLPGVCEDWEWNPGLLRLRQQMETAFEERLRAEVRPVAVAAEGVADALWAMTSGGGRSLSSWLVDNGTRTHAEELAMHRSAYQLKEADPHTWGIPRLTGRAKAAMVRLQSDEYGNGVARDMHSTLFADAMRALGLDDGYGVYLDRLPGATLATTNLISLFGLHRRLRGALVGHLALFEMTSVGPMGRYAAWLEALGIPPEGRKFYDVHVTADETHQHVAANDLVGGLLETEPDLADQVLFGARAVSLIEGRFATHLLEQWTNHRSSLRDPGW
jgi:hypothetical protein